MNDSNLDDLAPPEHQLKIREIMRKLDDLDKQEHARGQEGEYWQERLELHRQYDDLMLPVLAKLRSGKRYHGKGSADA